MTAPIAIVDLDDDTQVLEALEAHRRWAAYAICDLDPAYRPFSRFIGAVRAGTVTAVVLVFSPPSFTALLPCGDPGDVAAILAQAPGLPPSPYLLVQRATRQAVETRYRLEQSWLMLRLVVGSAELRPAPPVRADVIRLTNADLPALERFYASWPETVFSPYMFEHGVYHGAYVEGALVAAAGTHAISTHARIAVIGNVYTRPAHRGAGLATAVTGAVTRALVDGGARDIALNVREDNPPAIRAYTRLGFTLHEPFWEATCILR